MGPGQDGDNLGARSGPEEERWSGAGALQAGSIPHSEFEASVRPDPVEVGAKAFSRTTGPVFFRTTDIRTVVLPEGTRCAWATHPHALELIHPIAMEEGLRFAIREGGRTVGAGRVTKIIK